MKLKDAVLDMHQGINTVADKIEYESEGTPIIQSKNFTKGFLDLNDVRFLDSHDNEKYKDKYNPHIGDILMANIGTIGKSFVIKTEEKFLIAWNVFLIRPNNSLFSSGFIKYYFDYLMLTKHFEGLLSGGTVKFVNKKKIGDIELPPYNIDEQIIISKKLETIEKIINNRQKELQTLDDLIKARFVELFGHVSTMNSSPIKMSEVLTVNPKKDDIDDDVDVTFLPMEKIGTNGSVDTTEIRKYKDVKKGFNHIKENDVLFAKITPCMENGKATIARGLCNGYGNSTTELFALRCNEDVVPEYIFQIVHSEYFRKCAEENMTGTAGQRRVPKSFIEGFNIVVPTIELQNEFAEFVQEVDKSKVVVQKALDEAQLLFDSLMQQYFG